MRRNRDLIWERTWAIATQRISSEQSSKLNYPSFLANRGLNSEESGIDTNPLLTAMALTNISEDKYFLLMQGEAFGESRLLERTSTAKAVPVKWWAS